MISHKLGVTIKNIIVAPFPHFSKWGETFASLIKTIKILIVLVEVKYCYLNPFKINQEVPVLF